MTTYNTGAAVPSVDVRDLYDNAENFDKFSNGSADEYADRLGVMRQSLQGIRNASQYVDIGPYAAGLVFTSRNQVFSYDAGSGAEFYAPGPAITLPYTTTGVGAAEVATFRSVGDAILRGDLAGNQGGQLVSLTRINGTSGRTVADADAETVSITQFFLPGQSDWTEALSDARDYCATKALTVAHQSLIFPTGVYSYTTSPNWAITGLRIIFDKGVTLQHTGTGAAFIIDGGATGPGVANMHLSGMPQISGSTDTTNAMYIRAVHHSKIEAKLNSCNFALMKVKWSVCCEYWIKSTQLFQGPNTPAPNAGIDLDERDVGETVSACTFHNPILENISGFGLVLNAAWQNTFIGGTSEANTGGVYIDAKSHGNTFHNLDMEFNTGGSDVDCRGHRNTFVNCLSTKLIEFEGVSTANSIIGGTYNSITIAGSANSVINASYRSNFGSLINTGTGTRIANLFNLVSGLQEVDVSGQIVTDRLTLTAPSRIGVDGYIGGQTLAEFNDTGALGAPHKFLSVNGTTGNAAACGLRTSADSVTGRGINAGGTVNASGADYAEYVKKSAGCAVIKKGEVCGLDKHGEITHKFSESVTFLIKSTDPSYVGGDIFEPEDRENYDRMAFSGIVPLATVGGAAGDYVVPYANGESIGVKFVGTPEYLDYLTAVGRVSKVDSEGYAMVLVKVV